MYSLLLCTDSQWVKIFSEIRFAFWFIFAKVIIEKSRGVMEQ